MHGLGSPPVTASKWLVDLTWWSGPPGYTIVAIPATPMDSRPVRGGETIGRESGTGGQNGWRRGR